MSSSSSSSPVLVIQYFLFLILVSTNQILVLGQQNAECHFPRLTPRHGLNLPKLMGRWFLHEFAASDRGFDSVVPTFKCNQLNYVPEGDVTSTGKLLSIESNMNTTSGRIQNFEIPITIPKLVSPVSAIWNANTLHGDTKMLVLNTDREHAQWYILYSCNINGQNRFRWETVGIWSRSKFLDPLVRNILKDFLIGLGFPLQSHKFHSQEGC